MRAWRCEAIWYVAGGAAVLVGLACGAWALRPRIDVPGLLGQADAAISKRDLAMASQLVKRVLKRFPTNPEALVLLGRIAAVREQWTAALECFGRVSNGVPAAAQARYFEGLVYLEMQQARPGEHALLQAATLNPEWAAPHEELADLYASQLRVEPLRQQLSALLAIRPWTLSEFVRFVTGGVTWGMPAQRVWQMRVYFTADPNDVDSAVAYARVHLSFEHGRRVQRVLEPLLRRLPDEPRLRAVLAEARLLQGDLAGAAELLDFQPAEVPALLWLARGQYALRQGQWSEAVPFLKEAVRLEPDNIQANYRLGRALQKAGRQAEASQAIRRAETLDRLQHRCMHVLGIEQEKERERNATLLEIGDLLAGLDRWAEAALAYERVLGGGELAEVAEQKYWEARRRWESLPPEQRQHTAPEPSTMAYRPVRSHRRSQPRRRGGQAATVRFADLHREMGVQFWYFTGASGLKYLIESMGGGVAAPDFDADGWPDLFFPQGCRLPVDPADRAYVNQLYRNLGGSRFVDVTELAGLDAAGYSIGCVAGDLDNDGFADLVVTNFGPNLIYRNNGDGTFTDVTDRSGISGRRMSTSAALADLDRDGDLDLYVVNYQKRLRVCRAKDGTPVTCHPRSVPGDQDALFENRGDGTFTDVTESAGVVADDGKGLGVVAADLDDDRWPDIYVANDTTPNFLFQNQSAGGSGRILFHEIGLVSGTALNCEGRSEAGMGIACADLNGDGRLDLYVTNYHRETNTLYVNQGDGLFADQTREARLARPTLSVLGFGTSPIDADLDGRPDLFVANGHVEDARDEGDPYQMPPQFFYNLGGGQFADISRRCAPYFRGRYLGRGVCRLDWDRDGRTDLAVVHQDRPVALLHNETPCGHRLVVELIGVASNRDAANARLHVTAAGRTQTIELADGNGYLGSDQRRQTIGLAQAERVEKLEVRWPSGRVDRWQGLPADRRLLIVEGRPPMIEPLQGS